MNNRRALAFFLLIAAGCGKGPEPAAPGPAAPPPLVSDDIRILAFGDSLTAGKDLEDPDQQAYPAVLQRLLREKGYDVTVINAGHSGDTTFDALARLDFSLEEKPDVALVALGSNDTFQGKSLKDIEKNLEEILRRIKAAGVQGVLCAMKTFPNFGPDYAGGYEAIFPRAARRNNVPLVPFFLEGVADVDAMKLPDGVHPNAKGHERIARNILPSLEAVLKKRGQK
jgi:acyl-CoA thioesterase-1